MGYKDWVDERAQELADELYNMDYYDLTSEQQADCWLEAENEYIDNEAALIAAHISEGEEELRAYEDYKTRSIEESGD